MATEIVRELIDAGVHFGHRASRWNPKMAPYIYGKRNLIHIIDIRETIRGLLRAQKFLAKIVSNGQDVLFVGTKRQAKFLVEDYATKTKMPYVSERWLGGTLTNFRTIRSRLSRLEELEGIEANGELAKYSKKMIATLTRQKNKMKRNLDGMRKMNRLPGALVVVDVRREHIAVKEAKKLKIPTVCLTDTDSDPDYSDILIPGNDDAIRAIDVILSNLADAVNAGLRSRPAEPAEDEAQAAPRRGRRKTTTATAEEMAVEDGVVQRPVSQEPVSTEAPRAADATGSEVSASEPSVSEPSVSEPSVSEPSVSEPSVSGPSDAPEPVAEPAAEIVITEPVTEPAAEPVPQAVPSPAESPSVESVESVESSDSAESSASVVSAASPESTTPSESAEGRTEPPASPENSG